MTRQQNRYDWCPWFAWYPVLLTPVAPAFISGGYVWLRWVECRIVGAVAPNGDLTDYWEYRSLATMARGNGWIIAAIVGFPIMAVIIAALALR